MHKHQGFFWKSSVLGSPKSVGPVALCITDERNPSRTEPVSSIWHFKGEWTFEHNCQISFFCGNSLRLPIGAPLAQLDTLLHHRAQCWTHVLVKLAKAIPYILVSSSWSVHSSMFSSCWAQTSSFYFIELFMYIWDFSVWLAVVTSWLS